MGHRLSKIVTRTGDDGSTGLGDGSRVSKDSARIEALGEVDELNSVIGLLRQENLGRWDGWFGEIQHDLFDLGSELAVPGYQALNDSHIERLEEWLGELNAALPPLKEFILPGGSRAASVSHVARSVCRRAERRLVTLSQLEHGVALPRQYLNRLSDMLFIFARVCNAEAGVPDVLWQPRRSEPQS